MYKVALIIIQLKKCVTYLPSSMTDSRDNWELLSSDGSRTGELTLLLLLKVMILSATDDTLIKEVASELVDILASCSSNIFYALHYK